MKKFLLMALCAILYSAVGFAQTSSYDNQKTSLGEIYKAVYHQLDTKLPSVGRMVTSPVWNIIKEEIDGDKSTLYYEIYYDYSKLKARFNIEQLKHTISALEQIWQEWSANNKQKGVSMYFAKMASLLATTRICTERGKYRSAEMTVLNQQWFVKFLRISLKNKEFSWF